MTTPRFSLSSRPIASGLALLIGLAHGSIASAQGHTADPYRPYNSVYDPYVYPSYPGEGYFPNQNQLLQRSGPPRANQFQQFLEEDGLGTAASSSGSTSSGRPGVPYYNAHRRFNPNNRPNNSEADRLFRERQEERDKRYFEARRLYQEAVSERNPQKRARLIQQYAAAKRLAEQDPQRPPGQSRPGLGSSAGAEEPANPPPSQRPQNAAPRPSASTFAPTPLRETNLPGTPGPRSSPPPARPGRVGSPPTARSPSQILRESESLDREDRSPTPPTRPRLAPSPEPR